MISLSTTSASIFGELKLQTLSNISNPGGSFSDGIYTNTELHNKGGTTWDGALAKVVISGGSVIEVTITAGGAGYIAGEVLDIKGFSGADVTIEQDEIVKTHGMLNNDVISLSLNPQQFNKVLPFVAAPIPITGLLSLTNFLILSII